MKNKTKLLFSGFAGLLALTGCEIDYRFGGKNDYIRDLQNTVIKKLADNKEILSKVDIKNASYLFTKYQISDIQDGLSVDIYGKLSDGKNYKSYIKLNFDNVDKSFVDQRKMSDPDRPYYCYDALINIVKNNSEYELENIEVKDFEKLDNSIKSFVPKTYSKDFRYKLDYDYKLDNVEVLSLDDFNYNISSETLSFNLSSMAEYISQYTTYYTVEGGVLPNRHIIKDQAEYDYKVDCYIPKEDFQLSDGSTKYMLSKFTEFVENNQEDKYSVTLKDDLAVKSREYVKGKNQEKDLEL